MIMSKKTKPMRKKIDSTAESIGKFYATSFYKFRPTTRLRLDDEEIDLLWEISRRPCATEEASIFLARSS